MDKNHISSFKDLSQRKGVKIVHLNIRSLLPKIDQLRQILVEAKIDIITLSETWLKPEIDTQLVEIDGYTCYRLDRNKGTTGKKRGGGGLATYIKNELATEVVTSDMTTSNNHIEIQWIELRRPKAKNILLANAYRPPGGAVKRATDYIAKSIANCTRIKKTFSS